MAIQGFFTGDVKIRDLNGVLKAVDGIVEVATDAGTVTSVGLTVGSTGTDVNVANSPVTTSGNITLNLPTASATNRGLLSSADWTTFNSKQGAITLTTTGSSGAATLIGTTLNIPNYTGALAGYVPYTGATTNVNLGEYGISSGYFQADLTPSGTLQVGRMQWNSTDGTMDLRLMGNNVTLQIGQEQVARVVNGTGGNLLEANYQAVKIIGAQGQRLQVGLARADNDANSKDTLGLVTENINNNQEGFITVSGLVNEINTTGSLQGETWADGDTLYLSGTTSGAITNVKPTAPTHTVIVGFVVYAHANHGKIFVKVDNGYELEELHDVAPTPYVNKGVLYRDTATNLWKSATIGTLLGYTPANAATTLTINGTAYDLSANRTWNVGTVTSIGTSGPLTGGTITGSGTIGITQSSAASDGYLSNTDWATFNNKQTALNGTGFVKISGTTISYDNSTYYLASNPSAFIALTALSATAPLSYDNTTGVFSISQATTSTNGYLSSTDWNTFNNKQAAGSYITALTGEATATGPGSASVTLSTSAVTGKILTGLNLTGGGTIADTDSILQAFGKVQNQISGLAGGVTYQGVWNASTNTPTLTSSVGTKGYYYIVDVAGSTNLNGITDWKVGDWVIFNGSTWDKVDNTDAVSSVNGFTGAVSLTTSNIAEGTNLYYLDSRARLALSFTAGSGAYDNTTGVITIPTNTSQLTNGANFITLSSLSASSPLSYNSGTGALSIQVANGSQNGYLSSTDWTTFNSKQAAGNYVTTDTVQTITALKTFTSKVTLNTGGTDDQLQIVGTAPSVRLTNAVTGATINGFIAMSGANDNYIQGSVSGDMTIGNQNNGKILFGFGSGTSTQKLSLDSSGNAVLSGGLTLGSTLSNGTYTYTLPGATGTLALTSQIPANPVGGTGTTNYIPKFTGTSTIGNSLIQDNGTNVSINVGIFSGALLYLKSIGATAATYGFYVANSASTATFYVNDAGNGYFGSGVGIGTNPSSTYGLDVNGATRITGNLTATAFIKSGGTSSQYLMADGSVSTLTNPVTGTGTTNYLPKFTGASTIGNSTIQDNTSSIVYTFSSNPVLNITDGTRSSFFGTATSAGAYVNASQVGDAFIRANNGIVFSGANGTGGELRLTSTGNLGLGVTPSAWVSSATAFEFGTKGEIATNGDYVSIGNNRYINTSGQNIYKTTDFATTLVQVDGQFQFFTAPSGTAGNAISFTQAMTLNASGNLSIGNTNDTYKLDVSGTGRFMEDLNLDTSAANTQRGLIFRNAGSVSWQVYKSTANDFRIYRQGSSNDALVIGTNDAATFSSSVTAASTLYLGNDGTYGSTYRTLGLTGTTNGTHRIFAGTGDNMYIAAATGRGIVFWTDGSSATKVSIDTNGTATFSNRINGVVGGTAYNTAGLWLQGSSSTDGIAIGGTGGGDKTIDTYGGTLKINGTAGNGLSVTGAATFSSSVTAGSGLFGSDFLSNETSKVGIAFESGYGKINAWGANTSTYGGLKFQISASNGGTATPLIITPSGNVGIATTSINDRFVVDGGNNIWAGVFRGTTTASNSFGIQIFAGTNSSDTAFRILNGATTSTYLMVRGDGNVGIGTTSPNGKMTVVGNTVDIRNGAGGYGTGYALEFSTNANIPRIDWIDNGAYTGNIKSVSGEFIINNSSNNALLLQTNNTERMRIGSDGTKYFGVYNGSRFQMNSAGENFYQYTNSYYIWGLYNNSNSLNIESAFEGNIIFRAQNQSTSSSPTTATERMRITSGGLILYKGSSTTTNAEAVFENTNSLLSIESAASGSVAKDIRFVTSAGATLLERMRITSGGNVGIGTNSPTGYTGANLVLHLNTSSTITDLKLTNGTTGTAALAGGLLRQDGRAMYLWNVENSFLSFGTNNGEAMRITNGGAVEIQQTIKTGAPTNGTAQPWKLGNAVSGSISTDSYIIVSVNGTTYSIPALNGLP